MAELMKNLLLSLCIIFFVAPSASAQDIDLPEPDFSKPIIQAYKNRETARSFSQKDISMEVLSEVLYAAFGVNRPESGNRTAASGGNSKETDIYVLLKTGTYIYNANEHRLDLVTKDNLQSIMHTQSYAKDIPVHLAYVSNTDRLTSRLTPEYTYVHAGLIAQNVEIYCSYIGLAAGIRTPRDGGKLNEALNLTEKQVVTIWHAIGYHGESTMTETDGKSKPK